MTRLLPAAAAALAPAAAWACPSCGRDAAEGTLLLVAAMIAAPYLIAAVVIRAVRAEVDRP